MKLTFEKQDLETIRVMLIRRGIHENHPSYDDFVSDIMLEFARMMHMYPDYEVTSKYLKHMIIKRSFLTTMQKITSHRRKRVIGEWRGATIEHASVPSTVEARIDARTTYDLLPERDKALVQNRLMGEPDLEFARRRGVSKQSVSQSMRRTVKRVTKGLK